MSGPPGFKNTSSNVSITACNNVIFICHCSRTDESVTEGTPNTETDVTETGEPVTITSEQDVVLDLGDSSDKIKPENIDKVCIKKCYCKIVNVI